MPNHKSQPKTLCAEVIAIGDEMTSGARLDTNSQWLTQQLSLLGIRTIVHTTVGDVLEHKIDVFKTACNRADFVVSTGGLGPTADDLTREVIATVAGVNLELDQPTLDHIKDLFAKRGRRMTESNVAQARFPVGCRIIPNPHGTAPGVDIDILSAKKTSRIIALPGVPYEMKQMWQDTVCPALELLAGHGKVIRHLCLNTFGAGESEIENILPDLIRRDREPRVGITASQATISLRITATNVNEEKCLAEIAETEKLIREYLGDLLFGVESETLQDIVVQLLGNQNQTIAIADCATNGLVARWIHQANQSAKVLSGSISFCSDTEAIAWLRPQTNSSTEIFCVKRLAEATQKLFRSGISLAIGPVTDPSTGDTPQSATLAIRNRDQEHLYQVPYVGHPALKEIRCAKQILNELRLLLK